jgi:hypothetical protein
MRTKSSGSSNRLTPSAFAMVSQSGPTSAKKTSHAPT